MGDQDQMIVELKKHLDRKGYKYSNDSIHYKGLRRNVPQMDGNSMNLFVVSFLVPVSSRRYDSDATYYAYFDEKTKLLLYIIGPQFFEKI